MELTLADLEIGDVATIESFDVEKLPMKLITSAIFRLTLLNTRMKISMENLARRKQAKSEQRCWLLARPEQLAKGERVRPSASSWPPRPPRPS